MDTFTVQLSQKLAALGCQHPEQAARNVERLAPDAAARSQLEAIIPALLTGLRRVPDPDLALNNMERFHEAVLDRRFLLGLYRDNPRILHLFLTIFGSSQFLSDILVRHPQLFEWLLEPGVIRRPKGKEELRDEARIAGSTNEAGVWRCDAAHWLRWNDGDGRLWLAAPLPAERVLRIVGGPARKLVVGEGPDAGKTYVGGDADGFERLIIPAERRSTANAWYRLGQPALLGPQFGRTPHWGRVEIEPQTRDTTLTFLTVLMTDRADAESAPEAELERADDALTLKLRTGADGAQLRLPVGMGRGGTLEVTGGATLSWTLPAEVAADEPLP